jgi:hypothetical protein
MDENGGELEEKVYNLTLAGLQPRTVAKHVGLSTQQVQRMLGDLLPPITEQTRRDAYAADLARLGHLLSAHWPKRSDPQHAAIILAILSRRGQMMGTDCPTRIDIVQTSVAEYKPNSTQKIRALLDRLAAEKRPGNGGEEPEPAN